MSLLRALILFHWFLLAYTAPCFAAVNYTVKFDGIPTGEPLQLVRRVSDLVNLRDKPPDTMSALRHRAESDIPPILQILHGQGYYDAVVITDLTERRTSTIVTVQANLGPLYRLGQYRLKSVSEHPEAERFLSGNPIEPDPDLQLEEIALEDFGLALGKPALAKQLLESQETLLSLLFAHGYPLARIEDKAYVADQSQKVVNVTLYINSGPKLVFGPTTITGLEKTRESFVLGKIGWAEGDDFDPEEVEKTREALTKTRLFSTIHLSPSELPKDNTIPIDLALTESKHRSVSVGLSYNTDLGPGVSTGWEHRNMRGLGEKLSVRGEVEDKNQQAKAVYRKPDFRQIDQDLLGTLSFQRQVTDTYSERTYRATATLERKISERFSTAFGAGIKHINTTNSDNNSSPTLLTIPLRLRWSNVDDVLEPTHGATFLIKAYPQASVPKGELTYLKQIHTASYYRPLTRNKNLIFAGKVTLGSITGATRLEVPPPDRFYAGSESLLRGYQRLTVSPLDMDSKPIGGRSLLVSNCELRLRAGEDIGWVAFFESGNVYESSWPRLSAPNLKSAGIGFRYHTPVGPVRVDIAFPLDRRPGVDESWELYLNLGQAF